MRVELFQRINELGIGAQGIGGLTTVVDVKISRFPRTQLPNVGLSAMRR